MREIEGHLLFSKQYPRFETILWWRKARRMEDIDIIYWYLWWTPIKANFDKKYNLENKVGALWILILVKCKENE